MLRHKNIDRICCAVLALTIALTAVLMTVGSGVSAEGRTLGYENRLFDQSRVHTIDIVMDDWDAFLDTCVNEEYSPCTVIIDGESYGNAAIRGKGNTSLSSVAQYGNDRYSFKIEFDQYQSGRTYHGLDKLSLNNLIQDKTYLKDYVAYTLMNKMGAAAPLCSFVQIRVNGEEWGLYLAVEGVEDSFLKRNYGSDYGELYKPDSLSFGGGRGNGMDFDMDAFAENFSTDAVSGATADEGSEGTSNPFGMGGMQMPGGFDFSQMGGFNPSQMGGFDPSQMGGFDPSQMGGFDPSQMGGMPGSSTEAEEGKPEEDKPEEDGSGRKSRSGGFDFGGMGGFGMGSTDVKLQYTDDDPASYSNIFNNAKTDITPADQARLIASLKTLTEGEDIESVVDVEAVIRYFVVHSFMCNDDSYTGMMIHNYYLYEEDGVLSMIPWDYNLALGGFSMGGMGSGSGATSTVNSPIDTLVSMGDLSSRPMAAWIFADEKYSAMYHEIYAEFMADVFENGWFETEMTRVIEMIAPYVEADVNGFFSYEEFLTAAEGLMEFCDLRAQSISGQLSGDIPSTTEGQRTASDKLIDASHIDLSDLGEFGMGGRGGMGGGMPSFGGFDPSSMKDRMPGGDVSAVSGATAERQAETDIQESDTATEQPGEAAADVPSMGGRMPSNFDPSQMGGQMPSGFDPSQMGGQMPGGFDPSQTGGQMPLGFDPSQMGGQMPSGFDPSQMGGQMPSGFDPSQMSGQMPGGFDPSSMFGGMSGGFDPFSMGGQEQAAETDTAETQQAETDVQESDTATEQPGEAAADVLSMGGQMPSGFDPSQMGGQMPGGFDPSQMGGQMPGGFDPSQMGGMPEAMPEAQEAASDAKPSEGKMDNSRMSRGNMPANFGGMGTQSGASQGEKTALLIGSAAVLLIAIIFAKLFKGKR